MPLPVFAILSRLVEAHGGLHFSLADRDLFASKASVRAGECGFDSLLDYYYFLRYDPRGLDERDRLLEVLLNHETYFFREADQLTTLIDSHLSPQVRAGTRPRVWCSAASSGEEPYTLAMLLAERAMLDRVELIASDVSAPVLSRAQVAVYGGRSLRAITGTVSERWLEPQGEQVEVAAALRSAISWKRVNLVESRQVEALGQFDAILCRNVLIYFDQPTAARVLERLTAALKVGGLLLVGAAESLIQIGTQLGCEEHGGSFFYRRTA